MKRLRDGGGQLTADQLKEVLEYDSLTGKFKRKLQAGSAVPGDAAGSPNGNGRLRILVLGKKYYAHRLAFLYMTGKFPTDEVDHINLDPTDNRFENLRESTHWQNQWNKPVTSANRSGFKGVHFSQKDRVWYANIWANKKRFGLGSFKDPAEAHAAYVAAAIKYHGDFRRT